MGEARQRNWQRDTKGARIQRCFSGEEDACSGLFWRARAAAAAAAGKACRTSRRRGGSLGRGEGRSEY